MGRRKLPRGLDDDMFEESATTAVAEPEEPEEPEVETEPTPAPKEEPKAAEKPKTQPAPQQPPKQKAQAQVIRSPHDIPVPSYPNENNRPKHVRMTIDEVRAFRDKIMVICEAEGIPFRSLFNQLETPLRGLAYAMQKGEIAEVKV